MTETPIAYLGMGIMGSAMAANMARAGCRISVWNRTPNTPGVEAAVAAGARRADSVADAVAPAKVVFTCVSDVPDVESVLFAEGGVADTAAPNTLVVDMSTIGPVPARAIKDRLAGHNLRFLDAPVTGGDIGARNGTLTVMVGGDAEDLDECLTFLEKVGKNIQLCGPTGSGQAVKLCNQILCAVNMVSLCEAMALAETLGVDPKLVVEVCGKGAGGSWALSNLGPKILDGDLKPAFMVEHIIKDLRLIEECLEGQPVALPGTALATEQFKRVSALDQGNGARLGTQAMIRAYERAAAGARDLP